MMLIRENILYFTDSSSAAGIKEAAISPDMCLDIFHPIDLQELITAVSSSKSSTCILDLLLTRLLKEVLPLISNPPLNIINQKKTTPHLPLSFKDSREKSS